MLVRPWLAIERVLKQGEHWLATINPRRWLASWT